MIVIASMPLIETNRVLAGPAVLKSALALHGISSIALDLNVDIFLKFQNSTNRPYLRDFFYEQIIHDEIIDEINLMLNYCATQIVKFNPTVIGLSLFADNCQVFTTWLCALLKQMVPDTIIVIGGPGIVNFNYAEKIKKAKLINDYISGDGEISFVKYIQGNTDYPGINTTSWQPVDNLNELPYPDYSDYNLYWYGEPSIPLIDSRGCVRNCEFCDVIELWKKFQYKTADSIFDEIIFQINKYNIHHFDFRSSITNGNLKEFRKLISKIADYNQTKFRSEQISWEGSFIVRPHTNHPEEMWAHLQQNNAQLFFGVESVIPRVRHLLGKHFENSDLDYHLQMAQKYNIPVNLLMISGYPSETFEDYETIKQWFRDRKHFANNPIKQLNISPLSLLPSTQLYRNANKYNIIKIDSEVGVGTNWVNQELNISPAERKAYYDELTKVCTEECNFLVV
jgi:radical SAM superfamily enzyme YgiQ (UPF0313 family)